MGRRTSIGPVGESHDAQDINGETPFSLIFGCDAVLAAEMHIPTSSHTTVDLNMIDLSYDLDAIEELREAALIRMAS